MADYEFQGIIEFSDEVAIDNNNDNDSFLMSLIEELQDHHEVEESDEERLNSVIQSLEAEIKSSPLDLDDRQIDGQDYLAVSMDDDNGWIEHYSSLVPSSPSHDMNLYMYSSEDHDEMSYNYGVFGFEGFTSSDDLEFALDFDQYSSNLWLENSL